MRQFKLFLVLLLLPANQVGLCGQSAGGGITIRELCCEYAKNPLGIDTPQPRFSWILESEQRAQMQSAYHVIVASSAENLRNLHIENVPDRSFNCLVNVLPSRQKMPNGKLNYAYCRDDFFHPNYYENFLRIFCPSRKNTIIKASII